MQPIIICETEPTSFVQLPFACCIGAAGLCRRRVSVSSASFSTASPDNQAGALFTSAGEAGRQRRDGHVFRLPAWPPRPPPSRPPPPAGSGAIIAAAPPGTAAAPAFVPVHEDIGPAVRPFAFHLAGGEQLPSARPAGVRGRRCAFPRPPRVGRDEHRPGWRRRGAAVPSRLAQRLSPARSCPPPSGPAASCAGLRRSIVSRRCPAWQAGQAGGVLTAGTAGTAPRRPAGQAGGLPTTGTAGTAPRRPAGQAGGLPTAGIAPSC